MRGFAWFVYIAIATLLMGAGIAAFMGASDALADMERGGGGSWMEGLLTHFASAARFGHEREALRVVRVAGVAVAVVGAIMSLFGFVRVARR